MKKTIIVLIALLFTLITTAQTEVREVGNFTKLNVVGSFKVLLIDGTAGTVTIEGDKETIALIDTKVNDGVLTIKPVNKRNHIFNDVTVKIPFAVLNDVSLTGSGSITGKKKITNDIKANLIGSGNININVDTKNVGAYTTGSGEIVLNGKAEKFNCEIVGSGEVKANELQSSSVTVTVNGSGNAKVYSNKELTGRINGSGNIVYTGEPKNTDLKRTGSGEFRGY